MNRERKKKLVRKRPVRAMRSIQPTRSRHRHKGPLAGHLRGTCCGCVRVAKVAMAVAAERVRLLTGLITIAIAARTVRRRMDAAAAAATVPCIKRSVSGVVGMDCRKAVVFSQSSAEPFWGKPEDWDWYELTDRKTPMPRMMITVRNRWSRKSVFRRVLTVER